MIRYIPSIRQKIIFSYYTIVAIIVGFSLFTFVELRLIDKQIMSGEAISDFFDTALEIRRSEKNYFLYGKDLDYQENVQYVARAADMLNNHASDFTAVSNRQQVTALQNNLRVYDELMMTYVDAKQKGIHRAALEDNIRKTGKVITTSAEEIAKTERKTLQLQLARYRELLFISIIALSFMYIAMGRILSRMVVKPLKSLEQSMGVIAAGTFEPVSIASKDREILSLTNAFNKMLKELELRQRHLVQSEKLASLGTLLAGVAHELNNPLSNISLSCQILMEELEVADMAHNRELLSMIDEQTDRAKNIVGSLLGFSRDKAFKKEAVSLKKLFEETIQFVKGQVPTRTYITIEMADDILISADKHRMQQAFLNLIKNALEAIRDEGSILIKANRHVTINTEKNGGTDIYNYLKYHGTCIMEEDTVDIEIHDTGSGIAPEILPRIFDPFFTTKDVGKGSGLGLSIVHEIIEEHDGCIAVKSDPGAGTTFFIRLPMPNVSRQKEK